MTGGPMPEVTPVNRPFWDGTAIGELRIRSCKACGTRFRFVSEWCPACWSTDLGWQVASGRGKVTAMTIVSMAPYESVAARVPYALALIELTEGPTMMSNVVGCDPSTVTIGMPVQVTFEPRGDLHLPQFRPA
jgi:uncharacterized OB-fold protein